MPENNELKELYEKLLVYREQTKQDFLHSGEPPREYDRGYIGGLNYTIFVVSRLLKNA